MPGSAGTPFFFVFSVFSPATCPHCGRTIPPSAPRGVCPACVVRMVVNGPPVDDQLSTEPDVPTALPQGFKDYDVLEEIGRGGMGVVYRARQKSLNREVSLKMILGGHFANAQALARFRAEAETTAHLQHPNIVAIHEVGEREGLPYLVMDYVAGRSLGSGRLVWARGDLTNRVESMVFHPSEDRVTLVGSNRLAVCSSATGEELDPAIEIGGAVLAVGWGPKGQLRAVVRGK